MKGPRRDTLLEINPQIATAALLETLLPRRKFRLRARQEVYHKGPSRGITSDLKRGEPSYSHLKDDQKIQDAAWLITKVQ
jgi:hypothetical protein